MTREGWSALGVLYTLCIDFSRKCDIFSFSTIEKQQCSRYTVHNSFNISSLSHIQGKRPMEPLTESDWRRLLRIIEHGDCVLLLGPGITFDPQDPENTPLTIKLAHTLADQLGDIATMARRDDPAHVAQIVQRTSDRVTLEMAVEDFYSKYAGQTTPVHRQLAILPFSLCIDITPVGFLAQAFTEVGKTPVQDYYSFRQEKTTSLIGITPRRPLIYHLLGSLTNPDSLVLTESDLLDFLVTVAKDKPPLPKDLTSRFSNPSTSFLFLGFGFQQWYFRILLHILKAHSDRRNLSLALEDARFFAHPDQLQTVLFYNKQYRIQFRHGSWPVFADELNQRFREAAQSRATAAPPSVADNAPTVFLCHCSEEAGLVADVSARLQQLGVRTWLDRQNLRGGDRWDQILHKALHEWVQYFVVLETPTMLRRTESYYYKEIDVALERARGFRHGVKFIFPAQLIPCDPMAELRDFQRTDLTQPDGIEQLAAAILDDWTRRDPVSL